MAFEFILFLIRRCACNIFRSFGCVYCGIIGFIYLFIFIFSLLFLDLNIVKEYISVNIIGIDTNSIRYICVFILKNIICYNWVQLVYWNIYINFGNIIMKSSKHRDLGEIKNKIKGIYKGLYMIGIVNFILIVVGRLIDFDAVSLNNIFYILSFLLDIVFCLLFIWIGNKFKNDSLSNLKVTKGRVVKTLIFIISIMVLILLTGGLGIIVAVLMLLLLIDLFKLNSLL